MRIVITGATGQVGSALVSRLGAIGHVIAADRSIIDLANPPKIGQALDSLRPDLIINPAAYTAVDQAEAEPDLAMLVNATAPGAIAQWAARRSVPLIHFSTDYVFDGGGSRPWRETDQPRPLSVYGASKLAGEDEIRAAKGASLIIRTSWVYAATGRNFLSTIANLARENTELRIVADQVGAPTSAATIAEAIECILEGKRTATPDLPALFGAAQGLVHLSASGEASRFQFAEAIVDGLRSRGVALAAAPLIPVQTDGSTPAKRPLNSRLNPSRLHAIFGITMPDWHVALQPELDKLACHGPAMAQGWQG
jgi:dTDP-4-dehydrorhamnose reductase